MKRKLNVIKCPKCGREYLPAEVFVPSSFFGRPDIIKRELDGTIKDFTGTTMDTSELYCCDVCNTSFKVIAKVTFDTEIDVRSDFSSDYSSSVQSRFTLKEF